MTYDPFEVIVTRKPQPPEPPPFVCACCRRTIKADRWRPKLHRAPVCHSCSNSGGHQVRIPGMTRGDHSTLQRLVAVTKALRGAAYWEANRGRYTSI